MAEKNIQNRIRIAISKTGTAIALRNNTGFFLTLDGRKTQAGLGPGTSDLIGVVSHVIRQEDVGRTVGLFAALEVKTAKGAARKGQVAFLDRVASLGGLAAVVRSTEEAISLIRDKWGSNALWKTTKRKDSAQ